jgi:GNAT superfamily N-acetyltransferase
VRIAGRTVGYFTPNMTDRYRAQINSGHNSGIAMLNPALFDGHRLICGWDRLGLGRDAHCHTRRPGQGNAATPASITESTPARGVLLFPEHRGKGLGTAAERLLADYLFSTTLANRLEATTEVDNVAEQRALEQAGFVREGVLRGTGFVRGQWKDGAMYARRRDDPAP